MQDDMPDLEDFVTYLSAIADRYPTGIPDRYIRVPDEAGQPAPVLGKGRIDAPLVFVAAERVDDKGEASWPLTLASLELLSAAVEKGMQLPLSEVLFVNLHLLDDDSLSRFAALRPQFVVVLGSEPHAILCQQNLLPEKPYEEVQGAWNTSELGVCMVTRDPASVLASRDQKRAFWSDLQEIMRRLKGS